MREFNGVPLEQDPRLRKAAEETYRATGLWLLGKYVRRGIEREREEDGVVYSLNLYDEAGADLATIEGKMTPNVPFSPAIGFSALSGGEVVSRHMYGLKENNRLIRKDITDVQPEGLTASDRADVIRDGLAAAVEAGTLPEQVSRPDIEMPLPPFYHLGTDAVTPAEARGMQIHFAQKIESGLYVPVTGEQAMAIQGF